MVADAAVGATILSVVDGHYSMAPMEVPAANKMHGDGASVQRGVLEKTPPLSSSKDLLYSCYCPEMCHIRIDDVAVASEMKDVVLVWISVKSVGDGDCHLSDRNAEVSLLTEMPLHY